jgi:hypothetical protein
MLLSRVLDKWQMREALSSPADLSVVLLTCLLVQKFSRPIPRNLIWSRQG